MIRRLLLSLSLSALATLLAHGATVPMNIIARRGDRLFDGEREFRFVSVNVPDVLQLITNYRFEGGPDGRFRLPDDFELRDAVETVHQLGGQVMRTFVITCRREPHPAFMFTVQGDHVAPNEAALHVLDRLLQLCHERGVRVIVPLVAYNSALRGDVNTYGPGFWQVGSEANLAFKDMLTRLLGRTNPLTGIPYRDDPAILGWHTGNELVIGTDTDRRAWLHDIAAFIKRLDARHLLIDGRNKPADLWNLYDEFAADPNLDAVSYHSYVNLPQANTPAGTLRLLREMTRGKKPLLVTEVAMYTTPAALRDLLDEVTTDGTSGALWWALRFHNRDGGFYKHSDRDSQFEDLNWPGFSGNEQLLPELARERAVLDLLADYAARIRGGTRPALAAPAAPVMLPAPDPGHLSWRGSTGARSYDLQRATSAAGPWNTIGRDLGEHLVVCAPLHADRDAPEGGAFFYRVLARNESGASAPSNAIGPVVAEQRWLVDEFFAPDFPGRTLHDVGITRAYAHTAYLDDIAIARKADAARSGTIVYRVPGRLRSMAVNVYEPAGAPPVFRVRRGEEPAQGVEAKATSFAGGRRVRFSAEWPAGNADTLEIEFTATAPASQAIGRVELAFTSRP
jgi:hypothetical protein